MRAWISASGRGARIRAQGDDDALGDGAGRGLHRGLRPAALGADRGGARSPGRGAVDAGTFLRAFTFGHVRQLDRVLADSLERAWAAGAGPGDRAPGRRCRFFVGEVHGYAKQGAALRLHPQARLSPDPRDPRRHRRGAAHPRPQGLGEHRARRPAVRRGADPPHRAGRRDRPEAAARRLGVLEQEADGRAAAGGLELLDRRAPATPHPQARSQRSPRTTGSR